MAVTIGKWFFGILGLIAFLMIVLSFTSLPYHAYHHLGTKNSTLHGDPDLIILLGGSGMPSPDGLIRTFYTAQAAMKHSKASIVIAHPFGMVDSLNHLNLMASELTCKGIDSSRIAFEPHGFNTRSQALQIAAMYGDEKNHLSVLLVTSPEHMYRAVKTFNKAGFPHVGGFSAFERPIDEEKIIDTTENEDIRVRSLSLRYNIWSYLQYELIVLKEYSAIAYYKLKGWI
ncbi:MAG: YdcF family protein [Bacteroidales bacterium]